MSLQMWDESEYVSNHQIPHYFTHHLTLAIATPISLLGLYLICKIQNSCFYISPTKLHEYPITMAILQYFISIIVVITAIAIGFGKQIIPRSEIIEESKFKSSFIFIFNLFRLIPTIIILITLIGLMFPPIISLIRQHRNKLTRNTQTQTQTQDETKEQNDDTEIATTTTAVAIVNEIIEENNTQDIMVIFRFVTRGISPDLMKTNLHANWQVLKHYDTIRIELVTDNYIQVNETTIGVPSHLFDQIVVPTDYKTANGTKYKARALHYAAMHSQFGKDYPNCYIFHCDEESTVTHELIHGIKDFVQINYGKIGHGCIVYRNEETSFESYLCHLADNVRVGEDLGRHRFQIGLLGVSYCGLKGSFLLIPNQIEIKQETSFDCCGEVGSIAEDSWWAIIQMQNNNKFAWCNGVLIEQSCFSIKDFIKQRRRWFSGAIALCKYHPAPWYYKIIFSIQTLCLFVLPIIIFMAWIELCTYDLIIHSANYYNQILLNINLIGASVISSMYLIGNFLQIHKSYAEKIVTTVVAPCLFILLGTIEAITVIWTLYSPDNTFEIVNKEGKGVNREKTLLETADVENQC